MVWCYSDSFYMNLKAITIYLFQDMSLANDALKTVLDDSKELKQEAETVLKGCVYKICLKVKVHVYIY